MKSSFFPVVFRLIAGAIDRNINITIFVYVPAQRLKSMFFFFIWNYLKDGCFEGKTERYRKQLIKLDVNKILRSRNPAAIFVVSFASFKSCDPSSDRVMPEVRVRAQASYGNMTVLSYLRVSVNLNPGGFPQAKVGNAGCRAQWYIKAHLHGRKLLVRLG